MMHSSVGTGMLAYVVGSKVMDVRTPSNNPATMEEESRNDTSLARKRECSSDSAGFSSALDEPSANNCFPLELKDRCYEDQDESEGFFDFPPLPVTDLFRSHESEKKGLDSPDASDHNCIMEDETLHNFKINDNVDLITESTGISLHHSNTENGVFDQSIQTSDKRVSDWLWTLHRIGKYYPF